MEQYISQIIRKETLLVVDVCELQNYVTKLHETSFYRPKVYTAGHKLIKLAFYQIMNLFSWFGSVIL